MDDSAEPEFPLDPDERKGRFELRWIVGVVLLLVVLGAAWTLIYGSPAKDRRVIDSTNYNPFNGVTAGGVPPRGTTSQTPNP